MLYVIHAYDEMYQGLHGMEEWLIYDCDKEDAISIARDSSLEVINSFGEIYNELDESVKDEIDFYELSEENNEDSEAIDQIYNDIYNADIAYDIYEIDEEKIKNLEKNSLEDLDELLWDSPEEFIKQYTK